MKKFWSKVLDIFGYLMGFDTTKPIFEEKPKKKEETIKVDENKTTCDHKFGPAKFVKGGGREQTCKLCGYIRHLD